MRTVSEAASSISAKTSWNARATVDAGELRKPIQYTNIWDPSHSIASQATRWAEVRSTGLPSLLFCLSIKLHISISGSVVLFPDLIGTQGNFFFNWLPHDASLIRHGSARQTTWRITRAKAVPAE